jgi:HAD superfamily hydrolase (TIGR01549 family)
MNRSAVIFDLDGTLTKPYLDFDLIRAEIGIQSGPILEAISAMTPVERTRADSILTRHEWEAARACELHEGAVEIVAHFRNKGHPVALLTRNTRPIVEYILSTNGFHFDAIRTREDGAIKPSAEPVLSLCEEFEAVPAQSWVVGDYLFDLQSGRSAGTRTVLMIGDGKLPAFASLADRVIRRLRELPAIIAGLD